MRYTPLTQSERMNIYRNILLLGFMLFISASIFGQAGRKKVVLSTGDTVLVVNQQSFLTKEDLKFLRKDTLKEDILDLPNDYNSLEAASMDLEKLLSEINVSQSLSKKNNESLSVRIATRNLQNLKKEQELRSTWDSIMAKEPTMEELTSFYELYGDKPSYFINGILVEADLVNKLRPKDIRSRNLRTIDTATGNPNGEIWYEVTPQAIKRLNLEDGDRSIITLPSEIDERQEPSIKKEADEIKGNNQERNPVTSQSKEKVKTEKTKEPKKSVRRIKESRIKD